MGPINLSSHLIEFSPPNVSLSCLEVHLIDRGDLFYRKGQILAETVYRQVWQTEKLIDENDYGVVVSYRGAVVGNINLQLCREGKLLKSECFFRQEHWQSYYHGDSSTVAEVSALALAHNLSPQLRKPTLMLLMIGLQTLCHLEEIQFLVTVQHDYLIRILTKSLCIPLFPNEQIEHPSQNVPQDDYWQRAKPPRVYYLEPLTFQVVSLCYSFLSYLNLAGIQTAFLPRINSDLATYSSFYQSWIEGKLRTSASLN